MSNPFKRNLPVCRPTPRGTIDNYKLTSGTIPASPDHDALQAIVDRRFALKLGVTLPVAAALAALAGCGPHNGRSAR